MISNRKLPKLWIDLNADWTGISCSSSVPSIKTWTVLFSVWRVAPHSSPFKAKTAAYLLSSSTHPEPQEGWGGALKQVVFTHALWGTERPKQRGLLQPAPLKIGACLGPSWDDQYPRPRYSSLKCKGPTIWGEIWVGDGAWTNWNYHPETHPCWEVWRCRALAPLCLHPVGP
jgi:hypothetical protein